jgi:hypothetical protein
VGAASFTHTYIALSTVLIHLFSKWLQLPEALNSAVPVVEVTTLTLGVLLFTLYFVRLSWDFAKGLFNTKETHLDAGRLTSPPLPPPVHYG